VRLLLSRGAKQEPQEDNGLTALHWAVLGDHPAVVAQLCAAPGAAAALALKTSSAAYGSRTPLAMAIHYGSAACEAVLRAHGATE
jgi:ankyrin repeat protein